MAVAALLKFSPHTRHRNLQTQHVFRSLCTNLHQNRVVIPHFLARTSISEMAAAAILKAVGHFHCCIFFILAGSHKTTCQISSESDEN
jgi:hypothetical protein